MLTLVSPGVGKSHSILDILHVFEKASDKKISYEIISRRKSNVAEYYANPSLAEKLQQSKAELDIKSISEDIWHWILTTK